MDEGLYKVLRDNSLETVKANKELVFFITKKAIELKVFIVEQDEKESQFRMILNFGHTIGHAVEAELSDSNHGLCVSMGMYSEIEIAKYLNYTDIDLEDFKDLLISYNLPYRIPKLSLENLYKKLKLDKKVRTKEIPLMVPFKIGAIESKPLLVKDDILQLFLSRHVSVSGIPEFHQVLIPGSKSLTNRYILLASLCKSTTIIQSPLMSEDTFLMVSAIQELGLSEIIKDKDSLKITGLDTKPTNKTIYVGNAGTVARFLAMTCLLLEGETIIQGSARMNERPIRDLVSAINSLEEKAYYLEKEGYPPILIKGGGFLGGKVSVNCKTSSQYVSSILMAAPLAKNDTELSLTGESEPTSITYINMTIQAMRIFGAIVEVISPLQYIIRNTGYKSPQQVLVEPDATSASYFFALAALHQKTIRVQGLGVHSTQGELEFVKVLSSMGCLVNVSEDFTEVTGRPLSSVQVNMNRCTDSFITAAMLMSTCEGISEITGIANQKVKECDRIFAVIKELEKIGVFVEEIETGIRIHGRKDLNGNYPIKTYNDHRIAMGFSVLSTIIPGLVIKNRDVVNKTFPTF